MIFDLQFIQGSVEWPRMCEAVIAAEEAGFGTLWAVDHFSGAMFGNGSMTECFSTLSAWAAVTGKVGIGSLVANVNNRSAGLLAVSAATVQEISGGRFVLGVGAGASPSSEWAGEQHALGHAVMGTMAERHAHLAGVVSEVGKVLSVDRGNQFVGFPLPKRIPVIVGANSVPLAEYAGRECDGVSVGWWHPRRAEFATAGKKAAGDRPFDVSVWDRFAPEMCDASHPDIASHAAYGAGRVILAVKNAPDPSAIADCARYLR